MTDLQEKLLAWFAACSRDLPWRRAYLPYHIWISEVMLQQTQMARAVEYFNRWCDTLPDIASVSAADEQTVFKLWEGLGYYSRARNILKTAQILVRDFEGRLPDAYRALRQLPGIGDYTAGAIMSLAFNQDYPAVDANVERVLARLFDIDTPVKERKTRLLIHRSATELIPTGQARNLNQALMELGALVCRPKETDCRQCPLNSSCRSLAAGTTDMRPVPAPPTQRLRIEMATGILCHRGKLFIQKRLKNGVWADLWEFPGGRVEPGETPAEAVRREYAEETELEVTDIKQLTTVRHSYLHYRVTLHCHACRLAQATAGPAVLHAAQEYRWVKVAELKNYAFPAGHRKLIELLLQTNGFAAIIAETG
ncbi:MAG: A/G-specific adenine glycosylase [Deltaproteobacteria bacterium RIFOXYD12_FULL_57_12]|nr:MAG: A/G-specific adenine glycosylase [Deltaproteobacteria bacterium RIFOXYD12_FULL_57_12]